MLTALRQVVQKVNAAKNLEHALEELVLSVKEAMQTEVCSVYLRQPSGSFVLMATEGLNKEAIGNVSLNEDEGLVGLVASRAEPINLEDAENHPRYRYFPETGEERYASFMGSPIIHHGEVLGVLVVQQRRSRRFEEEEEAFLVTLSAQLAAVIAHAEATGVLNRISPQGRKKRIAVFKGISGAEGVTFGEAVDGHDNLSIYEWRSRVAESEAVAKYFKKKTIRGRRKSAREAARSVLPNATETKIFVTGNVRSWRHFIELRGDIHAEAEIRALACDIARVMKKEAPNLFGDYEIVKLPDGSERTRTTHRKV